MHAELVDVKLDQKIIDDLIVMAGERSGLSIIGGHYCVSPELTELSNEGEAEQKSFEWAVNLHKKAISIGVESSLILFVNDIGVSPDIRKSVLAHYEIPANYLEILQDYGVNPGSVDTIFESAIRNRASKEVRKLKKANPELFEIMPSTDPRLVRCIDPAYCDLPESSKDAITVRGPSGEYLVVKEGSNPKCNTILAVLFDRVCSEHQRGMIVNCFNSIYQNRINHSSV